MVYAAFFRWFKGAAVFSPELTRENKTARDILPVNVP